MTIMRPTIVLQDRVGDSFAMMFDGQINLAARGLKKGNTAVVPWARKKPPKQEGMNGFIGVDPEMFDSITALPGSLERVFEVGTRMKGRDGRETERCDNCGKEVGEKGSLSKCGRCTAVSYCGKVCWVSASLWSTEHIYADILPSRTVKPKIGLKADTKPIAK